MSKKKRKKRNTNRDIKKDKFFKIANTIIWPVIGILAIWIAYDYYKNTISGPKAATPPENMTLVGESTPSGEGDKNPEQDKNIGDDPTNEPSITKAPDPLAEPQYINIVFEPNSFLKLKEKTDWLRDRLDIGASDLKINLVVTTFTDPHQVKTLNGEGPFTLQRNFEKRVEIPSDESAPLETGTTPAPPAPVDNKTPPSEESSSVADSTPSGEGDKNPEQDKNIGDNPTNEPSITKAPDPPPEQKFRFEDSFETVEQFEDIFNSPTDKNPGVGGVETFRLKVNPEVRSSQYQYEISIAYDYDGDSIESLPLETVFSAQEVSVNKEDNPNKSIQISLIDLPEWSFKQVEFSEDVLVTRVDLEGNKKKYIELNKDDAKSSPIRNVSETRLYNEKQLYCTTQHDVTKTLSQLWLPVLESTTPREGTRFAIIRGRSLEPLYKELQGSLITAKLRKEEEIPIIDRKLQQRVLEATDYITGEPIANMDNRIQYVMDSKDKLIGFSLSKSKQNQIDYYPITKSQAETMMNNDQDISFHPRYIDSRVQIVDAFTKSNIHNVEFTTDTNAFNHNNKPVTTINNVDFDSQQGYSFTINFAEPSSDFANWQVAKIWPKATNYVSGALTTQGVGRIGEEIPNIELQPEPRNIVILIPQSEQFKAQFNQEFKEGEYFPVDTDGSKDENTGNMLHMWRGEKGQLGLVPKFVKALTDTLTRQFRSPDSPDSFKNTEIDVYIYGNEGIVEYNKKMPPAFKGKSVSWPEMLSGGNSDAYRRLSHRFGKQTTVIALVGGDASSLNATDKYYTPTDSMLGNMQIALFAHKFDPGFEILVDFAENNSDHHHVIDEPNSVELLGERAAGIAIEVYNTFIKD